MTEFVGAAPQWLRALDESQLPGQFGADTVSRGSAYQRKGMVRQVRVFSAEILHAVVAGNGPHPYQVVIRTLRDGNQLSWGPSLSTQCSCPVQVACKHAIAALLAAMEWPTPVAPAPAWQAALDPVVAVDCDQRTPLGLRLELTRGKHNAYPRPLLRPVAKGKNGWIKTGASWNDIEYSYNYGRLRLEPAQRGVLLELLYLYRSNQSSFNRYGEPRVYLDELGPGFWAVLRRLFEVGVALLAPDAVTELVVASEPAGLVLDIRRNGEGPAVLSPGIHRRSGESLPSETVLLGSPVHGFFARDENQIEIGPVEPALNSAALNVISNGELEIPDADLPQFFFRYYPALRRQARLISTDNTVELPEISGPQLELRIDFRSAHVTGLAWAFTYRIGDRELRFRLNRELEAGRDSDAEKALLDTLNLPVDAEWNPVRSGVLEAERELIGFQTSDFVRSALPLLQQNPSIDVVVRGEPLRYGEATELPLISVATADTEDPDWFDLDVSVRAGEEDVPLVHLLHALSAGEDRLLLDSGTSIRLDRPELLQLRDVLTAARDLVDKPGSQLRITPVQAGMWEELVSLGVVSSQSQRWQRTVGALLSIGELPCPQLPAGFHATLRPYQLDGFQWLSALWDLRLGGVLADDMGLGKTVQTLAMAARAVEEGSLGGEAGPLLIVTPTSVMATWAEQAATFCPQLAIEVLAETENRGGHKIRDVAERADIVVTSYALFRIDQVSYQALDWSGLVLDEAQFVKNHQSKTYQAARKLAAPFKLAVTGTPMENSLMDLWSMFSITAPGLFPSPKRFANDYRKPIESGGDPARLESLRRRVRPLMLRRTKEEVATDLPPKTEQVRHVPLYPQHQRVYDTYLNRERQRVLGLLDDFNRNRIAVLKALTTLRQLSLDASLIEDQPPGKVPSAKIDVLVEDLREIAAEGHRALVFSQFTRFLGLVRDRLATEGISTCYLDGRTRDRQRRIAEFNDGDASAFLISLKAGGFGLNLTAADYVYLLDPWWNPAAEAQAVDRAHRIGQDKPVMVYRLISTGTIEEKVVALQERKRELFTAIVDGGAASAGLNAEDIRALLTR